MKISFAGAYLRFRLERRGVTWSPPTTVERLKGRWWKTSLPFFWGSIFSPLDLKGLFGVMLFCGNLWKKSSLTGCIIITPYITGYLSTGCRISSINRRKQLGANMDLLWTTLGGHYKHQICDLGQVQIEKALRTTCGTPHYWPFGGWSLDFLQWSAWWRCAL